MERAIIAVAGDADRVLAAALRELTVLFEKLRGNVLVVGGVMTRIWLHLRPLEDFLPRATADVDMGIDRVGLRLSASSRRVVPLLEQLEYQPMDGVPEEFRFSKKLPAGIAIVDLLVPKGASRKEPPVLEKGVRSLAAPRLRYALDRGETPVDVTFVDGVVVTDVRVPVPGLDAAFVLKGALAQSGARRRPDRVLTDTVDALTLAVACARDPDARGAFAERRSNAEARDALRWLEDSFTDPRARAARRVAEYFAAKGYPDGGRWAVDSAAYAIERLRPTQ